MLLESLIEKSDSDLAKISLSPGVELDYSLPSAPPFSALPQGGAFRCREVGWALKRRRMCAPG
jgi:hypothetical protein